MKRAHHLLSAAVLAWAALVSSPALAQESPKVLWEVGKADHSSAEFALSPDQFGQYRQDGFCAVGRFEAHRDWPYFQPGPADAWAGGRQHTAAIVFGIKEPPKAGDCTLLIDLVDTHSISPPLLGIQVNGRLFKHATPRGGGDESLHGNAAKGKEHKIRIGFPASLLRAGLNEIAITTLAGSWMIYDRVGLETPAGVELTRAEGTIVHSMRSVPLLVERGGTLQQVVQMTVRHLGEAAPAALRISGGQPIAIELRPGLHTMEVPIPAVRQATPVTLAVESAGRTLAAQQETLRPVRKFELYFLPHSHVDIGYTHLQTDVEKIQWRFLEQAVELGRKTANYPPEARHKWNVEVLWAVDSYLKQAAPEKRQAFIDAVKSGWIGLDAFYGNELTALCRQEELVRLVDFAGRLSREHGLAIDSAMVSDVPGYTWGTVTVLAEAGVKYFSSGPNESARIGSTLSALGDKPFYWVGPSGKERILCWVAGGGYSHFHSTRIEQSRDKIFGYLRRLEDSGYPYDIVQFRYSIDGDNGPPDPKLSDFARDWNARYAYPKIAIATTSELFRRFEARYGAALPKFSGDFTPYWEDGAGSSARETAVNREAAERLVQAEALWAMLKPGEYPAERFYEAWRNAILYDEHTWGAHNSVSEPDAAFVKQQWKIKQAFALDAGQQARQLEADALGARVATRANAVDVFNTASFARTDLVILSRELSGGAGCVRDSAGGVVPSQRLSTGELAFIAAAVPPFAAHRYRLSAEAAPLGGKALAAAAALRTGQLSVALDEKTGAIASFTTAAARGDLVARGGAGLNDYFYVPGADPRNAQRSGAARIMVKERGPLVASLVAESDAPGCNRLTREIRVIDGIDRVDILNTVDKKAVRAKEGVHFAFPFDVPDGVMRIDIPWAVARIEADQIPGSCKNWFTVQRWVDVSNKERGVTWVTLDAPLVEAGAITAELPWIEHLAPTQSLYSYVMNNYWFTNYKAEQDGPTRFRYAIRPHGEYRPDEAARFAIGASQPLIAVAADGRVPSAPRLTLDSPGVIASLKCSEDGKAWIVRLFGASGKVEKVTLTWSDPIPTAVSIADLYERPRQQTAGAVDVPAFGLVAIRAERP